MDGGSQWKMLNFFHFIASSSQIPVPHYLIKIKTPKKLVLYWKVWSPIAVETHGHSLKLVLIFEAPFYFPHPLPPHNIVLFRFKEGLSLDRKKNYNNCTGNLFDLYFFIPTRNFAQSFNLIFSYNWWKIHTLKERISILFFSSNFRTLIQDGHC